MNINGTKLLLQMLMEKNLKYLLTSKINQGALENLFSQLRSRGGLNDHLSPLNALHRLRMIILGKNPGIVSSSSNTADQNQEEFLVAAAFKQVDLIVKGVFEILEHQENMTNDSGTDTTSENESQVEESRNNSGKKQEFLYKTFSIVYLSWKNYIMNGEQFKKILQKEPNVKLKKKSCSPQNRTIYLTLLMRSH